MDAPESDHAAARTKWAALWKQDKRAILPQELSIQAFTLYQLRFVFAADLCSAWAKFGGIGPQLSRLSTTLHLGVTESVAAALAYRRIVDIKLQEKARTRTALTVEFGTPPLLASENFQRKEQAKKEIAMAVDAGVKSWNVKRAQKAWGRAKLLVRERRAPAQG